jgi:hypothetical protein
LVKVTSAWQNSKQLTKKAESDLETAKAVTLAAKETEVSKEQSSIEEHVNALSMVDRAREMVCH